MTDAVQSFTEAMRAAGLSPAGEIIADGRLHRVHIEGDRKGSDNGWYVLHLDDPASGGFGTWRDPDVKHTWTAKIDRKLSPEQKREFARRIEDDRRRRDEEQARVHDEAAERARKLWSEAPPANPTHEYLTRKKIQPGPARELEGRVMLPVVSPEGQVVSLQFISVDGEKRFLPGGRKRGCYCPIGARSPVLLICEGFATGMSLHASTGHTVIVAFDAGNLEPVTSAIVQKYPQARVVICADDDAWTDGNPGITAARLAAEKAGTAWVSPRFPDGTVGRPSDFNDLAQVSGNTDVANQIDRAVSPHKYPPEPSREIVDLGGAPGPVDLSSSFGVEAIRMQLPHLRGKDRKPVATIENLKVILERLGLTIRYNVISKEEEILIPGEAFSIDNRQNASFAWLLSRLNLIGMSSSQIGEFITYLADQNPFNPVAKWIESKPWDGVSRLPEFFATVTAAGEAETPSVREMKETLIRKWLLSAVAAAFRPQGVSAHGILVFQGVQDLGKTHWFKRLVPEDLGVIKDGQILRPDDRDNLKQIVSNWLVEIGELDATFRRSDIALLKAFITRDKDVLRRPYARKESEFARRTVFFASVNPEEFLHDPTGNRRYWSISCSSIDHQHTVDMQQVWAEIFTLYQAGASWYLTREEMQALNDHNRGFEVIDPIEEKISTVYVWDDPRDWRWLTATEILSELGIERANQKERSAASTAVKKRNGGTVKKNNGRLELRVPPRKWDPTRL